MKNRHTVVAGRPHWQRKTPDPLRELREAGSRGGPLGTYRAIDTIGHVKLAALFVVRDGWTPGREFKSASGRTYVVEHDGSLRRRTPKADWRAVRTLRRAITRGELSPLARKSIRDERKEVA